MTTTVQMPMPLFATLPLPVLRPDLLCLVRGQQQPRLGNTSNEAGRLSPHPSSTTPMLRYTLLPAPRASPKSTQWCAPTPLPSSMTVLWHFFSVYVLRLLRSACVSVNAQVYMFALLHLLLSSPDALWCPCTVQVMGSVAHFFLSVAPRLHPRNVNCSIYNEARAHHCPHTPRTLSPPVGPYYSRSVKGVRQE